MKLLPVLLAACTCAKTVLSSGDKTQSTSSGQGATMHTGASLNSLPDFLFRYMIEEFFPSYKNLLTINKTWYDILKQSLPQRLAKLANHPSLSDMSLNQEFFHFYRLFTHYSSWIQPKHVFDPYSNVAIRSTIILDWAVSVVQAEYSSEKDQLKFFSNLAEQLVEHENFELLAYLLAKFSPDFEGILLPERIYKLGKMDLSCLLKFLETRKLHSDYYYTSHLNSFLPGILFLPVDSNANSSDSLIQLLIPGDIECIDTSLESVIDSCTLDLADHSEEQRSRIYDRNLAYITELRRMASENEQTQRLASCACLNNEIRFGFFPTSVLKDRIMSLMELPYGAGEAQHVVNVILPSFLHTSIMAQRSELFMEIWGMTCFAMTNDLARYIGKCPDFVKRLSVDDCEKMLEQRFMTVNVLRTLKQKTGRYPAINKISAITDVSMRLVLLAEMGRRGEFVKAVKETLVEVEEDIDRSIFALISNLKDPVPFVTDILSFLDPNLRQYYVPYVLGHKEYVRALLKRDHDNHVIKIMSNFTIQLEIDLVHALLKDAKFAAVFSSDRGDCIRRLLHLSLLNFIYFNKLTYGQLLRLLEILGVTLNKYPFSIQMMDGVESRREYFQLFENGALSDMTGRAKNQPGFLAHLALTVYHFEDSTEMNLQSRQPNVLVLKSLELFEKWLESDRENFQNFAPPEVVWALRPLPLASVLKSIRLMCAQKEPAQHEKARRLAELYLSDSEICMKHLLQEELEPLGEDAIRFKDILASVNCKLLP